MAQGGKEATKSNEILHRLIVEAIEDVAPEVPATTQPLPPPPPPLLVQMTGAWPPWCSDGAWPLRQSESVAVAAAGWRCRVGCLGWVVAVTPVPPPQVGRDLINLVTSREGVSDLLSHNDVIDLVIPRGSNSLVRHPPPPPACP